MSRGRPRLAIDGDLFGDFVDALAEQMRQHICTDVARHFVRLWVAGGCHPNGQFGLDRPGQNSDPHVGTKRARERYRLATPQASNNLDGPEHRVFSARIVLWLYYEILWHPTGGEGDRHAPVGEVVHHRPFFGDADGRMQWRHDAPGADLNIPRDHRDGRAGHGGIRVKAAKFVEMPLRRPYRREAVLIGKLRPLDKQAILVGRILTLVSGEIEQTEVDWPAGMRTAHGPRSVLEVVAFVDHHLEATRQGPEELQYRDVEGQTRHCQPAGIQIGLETRVHPAKKAQYVAVFDHHALRIACGSGGVNNIGHVVPRGAAVEILSALLPNRRPIRVDAYRLHRMWGQCRRNALLRQ